MLNLVNDQKLDAHSPRRLLVEGNACCGIKAGDLLLTALPIDDRRGLALQAARRVLLGNPFEGCHAFRPGEWIDDRPRGADADVCEYEKLIPQVAVDLTFGSFIIEERVMGGDGRGVGGEELGEGVC